jgi:hypothetical protein
MIEFVQQNYPQSLPQVRATLTDSGIEKPKDQPSL